MHQVLKNLIFALFIFIFYIAAVAFTGYTEPNISNVAVPNSTSLLTDTTKIDSTECFTVANSITTKTFEDNSFIEADVENEKSVELHGVASYYHPKFNGRKTATGEVFTNNGLTAACNRLPLNSWIEVENLANNKKIVVKVNDRLAKNNSRLVDLTNAAAAKLGFIQKGIAKVKVRVLPKRVVRK